MPRHLVSIADLSKDEIEEIFDLTDRADDLRRDRAGSDKIMATLFYEPSTRTRLSFESAMLRLSGSVISSSDMTASSTAKGESLADTAKVVSAYADVMVVRHYWDGSVGAMAEHADIPVINAGDGGHEHPTQTLCDLYTLKKEKGQLRGLNVVICGDLKHGRTVHSLVYALARFGANVVALAAGGMALPAYVLERLEREFHYGVAPVAADDLRAVVAETDALYLTPEQPHRLALVTDFDSALQERLGRMVSGLRYDAFYMTRKQKERMAEQSEAGKYPRLGADFLREERFKDTVVMHPLPRVDELSPDVDRDRRGVYFKQAAYGVPVRMALLHFLLDPRRERRPRTKHAEIYRSPEPDGPRCPNPNCVTVKEPVSARPGFEWLASEPFRALMLRCVYCDYRLRVRWIGHAVTKTYAAYDPALFEIARRWFGSGELALFDSLKQAEELGYRPLRSGAERTLMNSQEIEAIARQLGEQIFRDSDHPEQLLLIGIHRNGALLARRIAATIEAAHKRKIELAEIELFGGAEEIRRVAPLDPELGPVQLRDRAVVVVDDVIYTGRTANQALSVIFKSGRPRSVRLAVLIDRGHRQVPLKPNYVGKHIPTSERERVRVRLSDPGSPLGDEVVVYTVEQPSEDAREIG